MANDDESQDSMSAEDRANQAAANFSKLSNADQAQFEKFSMRGLRIPDPKRPDKIEQPSQKWVLANPQTPLNKSDPEYLCEVCRHIDFHYLTHAPFAQMLDIFSPFSLKWVVQMSEVCAFCRLIHRTIRSRNGDKELKLTIEGKDVMCNVLALPESIASSGRGEISLALQPCPDDLDDEGMQFSEFNPQANEVLGSATSGLSTECPEVDVELVKKWCRQCLIGQCGSNPTLLQERNMPKGFRLIDVRNNCIVDFEPGFEYVALSYVWGGAVTLQNRTAIRASLTELGALSERSRELPNTIKDAMKLTDLLGERYLWVDSLCIVQDDKKDKAVQIAAMDPIYSSAVLTVAAASGISADTGLPGMSAGPRTFERYSERVQGVRLANRPQKTHKAIDVSVWNSRAWTFQERVVSPRILYLGAQRCFFTCQHRKDEFLESEDPAENGLERIKSHKTLIDMNNNLIPTSMTVNAVTYRKVVQAYTSRHLTFPSDILNAFKAIESRLCPLFRSDFVFGLPRSELDSQLLWQPVGLLKRRRDLETKLPIFPSWSWAGWVGEVECNSKENLSRIEWIESDGTKYSGKDFRYPAGDNANVYKRLMYRLDWRGALEDGVPYYKEDSNPESYFLHPTASENQRILGPNLKPGTEHLVFEAEMEEGVDAFHIGGHYRTFALHRSKCTDDMHTVCPLVIRDVEGFICGYVMVPGEISLHLDPKKEYNLINISRTKTKEQRGRGEGDPDLLVDEEDVTMEKQAFPDRPDVETSSDQSACDQRRYDAQKPWCLYNVLLVEWKGEVAERVGVGAVHIDAWAQAKPKRRVITLG